MVLLYILGHTVQVVSDDSDVLVVLLTFLFYHEVCDTREHNFSNT